MLLYVYNSVTLLRDFNSIIGGTFGGYDKTNCGPLWCLTRTVDRVINERGNVKPETKELVLSMAKELGYKPNPAGKALSARKKIQWWEL